MERCNSGFHVSPDELADTVVIIIDELVFESENTNAELFEKSRPPCIVCKSVLRAMLPSVEFDHQSCGMAEEVGDIRANDSLFVEFDRIIAQKSIPQFAFLRRQCRRKYLANSNLLGSRGICIYHSFEISLPLRERCREAAERAMDKPPPLGEVPRSGGEGLRTSPLSPAERDSSPRGRALC